MSGAPILEKIATRAIEFWARRRVTLSTPRSLVPTDAPRLVVSLTSYPPRYQTLALTLKSLLLQSYAPDAVVLWIATKDMAALPADVLALRASGLQIRECQDVRSYNKLTHALAAFPEASIAICDDDTYYWSTWLEELVTEAAKGPAATVVCHRAHHVRFSPKGAWVPYEQWEHETQLAEPSPLIFGTGVGGVLYGPGTMAAEVSDMETAMAICPSADDVWFYWMARLNGFRYRKIGGRRRFTTWRSSQKVALWQVNNTGERANDRQIAAMIERFGDVFH